MLPHIFQNQSCIYFYNFYNNVAFVVFTTRVLESWLPGRIQLSFFFSLFENFRGYFNVLSPKSRT